MTIEATNIQQEKIEPFRNQLNQALIGKADVIEMVMACLFSKGHLIFDDLPGLGKTTLSKAIAKSIGGQFARVQCTPDLLPTDVTGFNIFDQQSQSFTFREGPVFSDLLLTDEINRATPRTQSALFEAMEERQVTIDNQTYKLPETFMVLATQNPIESHGAYPLPEAQLDRFAMKLSIGYPKEEDEVDMLGYFVGGDFASKHFDPTISLSELAEIQDLVSKIEVNESIRRYLVELAKVTRNHARVHYGLSPRALVTWQKCAQSWAFLQSRDFVIPDDIQAVALPVLKLRVPNDDNVEELVKEIMESVAVPNESES